ncbi:AI-2E family transporter [Oceanihabitans sp.]|jgi:predicted PurR-regulated permease PerM|nr:AI-2E family transporter [Oceanihabitans sp.]
MKDKINITSFIRLAVVVALILWASLIVKPFIGALAWAIILAVAIYPFYHKLITKAGSKRKKIVSIIFTLVTVTLLAVPSYSIFSSVLESTTETIQQLKDGTLHITPPTEKVKEWPMGEKIYSDWESVSSDSREYVMNHKEFILEKGKGISGSFLGIMGTLVVFIISLIIAVVFMYNADGGHNTSVKFANKLVGKEGEDIVIMSRNTIRSVVKGILLVAIIQTLLSFIGFKLIGLPAAGLFTMVVMFAAIVQVPVTLAIIPAIILAFSISDNTTHTIIFTVYIIIVSLLDNFLKPILLSKGLQTPTVIIFLGAIGGVMLHGIIGLFVGTVVLALAHRFYMRWVNSSEDV